jgi:hypothetical protein
LLNLTDAANSPRGVNHGRIVDFAVDDARTAVAAMLQAMRNSPNGAALEAELTNYVRNNRELIGSGLLADRLQEIDAKYTLGADYIRQYAVGSVPNEKLTLLPQVLPSPREFDNTELKANEVLGGRLHARFANLIPSSEPGEAFVEYLARVQTILAANDFSNPNHPLVALSVAKK